MLFNASNILVHLQSCFEQGGRDDLVAFVLRHSRSRRWMIASDFNIGAAGAHHNVYAFAAYPVGERGYFEIIDRLKASISADFKRTRSISQGIKHFFAGDDCFCFVFLTPVKRFAFRDNPDHKDNLAEARALLDDLLAAVMRGNVEEETRSDIRRVRQEVYKRNLSLDLVEHILLFTIMNAFVAYHVASLSRSDHVGFFPDRDNMTTYANSAWASLAHLQFHGVWSERLKLKRPSIGVMDHRVTGNNGVYDELIRVPDFLAATLSRWHLESNRVSTPAGTARSGKQRYRQVLRSWAADNPKLWIVRLFVGDDGLRCGRIAVSRSRKRFDRDQPRQTSR